MTVAVADLSGAREIIAQRFGQLADDGFQALLVDMEADAPRDTGAMTQTITVAEADTESTAVRTIHAPQEYSSYQDEGVGPIYASPGKTLHFFLKDGTEVFVKSTKGVPRTGWWSDKVANLLDYLRGAMP